MEFSSTLLTVLICQVIIMLKNEKILVLYHDYVSAIQNSIYFCRYVT